MTAPPEPVPANPRVHTWAHRSACHSSVSRLPDLDLLTLGELTFRPPDTDRFRCLALAYRALSSGGTYPAVLNAANEIAVKRFLDGRLPFNRIPDVIEQALESHEATPVAKLEAVLSIDGEARIRASEIASKYSS